ncbi:hypothetical protein JCM3775_003761 [Rhodotorula graminis]
MILTRIVFGPQLVSSSESPPSSLSMPDADFWAASKPPEDGTCVFDRVPNEIVFSILSFLKPGKVPVVAAADDNAVVVPEPPPEDNPLLVVRQTCRLMNMLCARLLCRHEIIFDGLNNAAHDAPAQPFLSVVMASGPRRRAVRKLAFDASFEHILMHVLRNWSLWAEVLPNVDEIVVSGTDRVHLDGLARFRSLRHLVIVNADFAISPTYTDFRSLVSLVLWSATITDPATLSKSTMPSLRRLVLVNCRMYSWLYLRSRWATDLLSQLELLEVGEDRTEGADVRLLVPHARLPFTLPVLWHVDLDRALVRLNFPPSRAALRRRHFILLTLDDDDDDDDTASSRRSSPRDARHVRHLKLLDDILPALPNLELVLVPRSFWAPPAPQDLGAARQAAARLAHERQQAIVDECRWRHIALRTYEPREDEGVGFVPEFEAFVRERAARRSGATIQGRWATTRAQ